MKNIHILPTDKPSRLCNVICTEKSTLTLFEDEIEKSKRFFPQNIYITSDKEIKEGDWVLEKTTLRIPYIGKTFYPKNDGTVTEEILKRDLLSVNYKGHYETLASKRNCEKIILTTDQDLIADGIQAIDDEFSKWFVNNSSCEKVKLIDDVECLPMPNIHINKHIYKIIIPKQEQSTMKKQSSIDWLILEDWELTRQLIEKEITIEEYSIKHYDLVDQAKAMHKEEIETAYKQGVIDEACEIINTDSIETTYYSDTFE